MKKSIIITSIFEPTEAVKAFSSLEGYELVVVGDKKSPETWQCDNVTYLPINAQEKLSYHLLKLLPFNHYSRKMIGYLYAIQNNADLIIDTDDDNIPKSDWGFPEFNGKYECTIAGLGFINIYNYFTDQKIWPRGLPLDLINKSSFNPDLVSSQECRVGIWQGLADEDPDVDAIYRLTNDTPCYFEERKPIVLENGTVCPFNTQNTLIVRELFPLLYLPTYVTFRFTDILRGLVAQPIMWLYNYRLGFTNATVVQKRNPHDYMKDFISELPMYEHCAKVVDIVGGAISEHYDIANNLFLAYQALLKESIVTNKEITVLEAWLKDISNFCSQEV